MKHRAAPKSSVVPIRGIAIELYHHHHIAPPVVVEILAHVEVVPPTPVWELADLFIALMLRAWRPHIPTRDDSDDYYTLSFTWQWEDNRATDWEIPLVNDEEGAEVFDWQPGRLARELREAYLNKIEDAEEELPEFDYYGPDPEDAKEFILTHEIGG